MADEASKTAPTAPEISVVIPHYNDIDRLTRLLKALAETKPADAEIVVVDNNSTVDLAPAQAAYPMVRFLTEPENGAAAARNRGVAETSGAMLFFIDADCVPDPDWIEAGRAALRGRKVVGGFVGVFDETPPPRSGAEALETVLAFNFERYIKYEGFTGAGNMLTWREIFDQVGGFRGGLSEDIDWSHRARARGFSITYAPEVRVLHPTRRDWPALVRKWRRLTIEMYHLRDGSRWRNLRWALRALMVLGSPVRDIPKFLTTPKLADGRERWRGIATLLALRALRAAWMLRQAMGRSIG